MSRRLGWSQSYIAHRLTGRRPFTVDELVSIAAELDIPVSRLLPIEREAVA